MAHLPTRLPTWQLRSMPSERNAVCHKVSKLTLPLIGKIGLGDADCVISGDTAARPKPYPDPLFEAARQLHIRPEESWFVGDDRRDIQAGKAAGTGTLVAQWGYCSNPASWNADYMAEHPSRILELIHTLAG